MIDGEIYKNGSLLMLLHKSVVVYFYMASLVLSDLVNRVFDIGLLGYYDDLVIILLPFLVLERKALALLLVFTVLTLPALVNPGVSVIQYILDYKYLSCVLFVRSFLSYVTFFRINEIFKFIIVLNLVVVGFELVLPEVYQSLFSGDYGARFEIGGVSFYRVNGIFSHPGGMAAFSGLMLLWFFFNSECALDNILYKLLSLVLLLITFQRAEILSVLIVVVYAVWMRDREIRRDYFVYLVMLIFLSVFSYYSFFNDVVIDASDGARNVLYKGAILIFQDSPLFGVGPGVFGSHFSIGNFYVYDKLGFENFWWFNQNRYITDTFWPKVIGEYGLFGVVAWFYLIRNVYKFDCSIVSSCVVLLVFLISFQAPIYMNVKLMIISLVVMYVKKDIVDKSISSESRRY